MSFFAGECCVGRQKADLSLITTELKTAAGFKPYRTTVLGELGSGGTCAKSELTSASSRLQDTLKLYTTAHGSKVRKDFAQAVGTLADPLAALVRRQTSSSTSTTTRSGSWTTIALPWRLWASVCTFSNISIVPLALTPLGLAENETEISFFQRELYEAFKLNPQQNW